MANSNEQTKRIKPEEKCINPDDSLAAKIMRGDKQGVRALEQAVKEGHAIRIMQGQVGQVKSKANGELQCLRLNMHTG